MAVLDDIYLVSQQAHSDLRVLLDVVERGFEGMGGGKTPTATPTPAGATFGQGLRTGPEKIIALFAALEKSLVSFGNSVARFVEKANPNAVLRWNQAIADLQAVIGRALVPALESLTGMVRKIADAFASLSPEAKRLVTGLGMGAGLGGALSALATAGVALLRVFGGLPVLIGTLVGAFIGVASTMQSGKAIFQAFGSVVKALSAVVEVVALALVPVLEYVLIPALEEVASAAKEAASGLKDVVDGLRAMVGMDPLKSESSVGAAVRNSQIGDIQSYINRAYTSAFQGASKEDIDKQQLTELKGIRAILARSSFMPKEDSWASVRRETAQAGKFVGGEGGEAAGRRIGQGFDLLSGPFSVGPRFVVETMRQLFG